MGKIILQEKEPPQTPPVEGSKEEHFKKTSAKGKKYCTENARFGGSEKE